MRKTGFDDEAVPVLSQRMAHIGELRRLTRSGLDRLYRLNVVGKVH